MYYLYYLLLQFKTSLFQKNKNVEDNKLIDKSQYVPALVVVNSVIAKTTVTKIMFN
jgi:hypothetical protein